MEKQEAIDYILAEIEKGRSEDEIISELSQQLRAPKEIVAGFVNRTLASQAAVEIRPPQPVESGPVEEITAEPEEVASTTAEMVESQAEVYFQEPTELTTTGEALSEDGEITKEPEPMEETLPVEHTEWVEETYPSEQAAPFNQDQPAEDGMPTRKIQPEGAEKLVEDTLLEETSPPPAPVWDPDALAKKSIEPLSPGDRDRLEKAILAALAKHRRQSDVVMMVCERTGMSWDQSQRLVAEVSMKNRSKLNRREGTIQILLSLLAVLAGLAVIFSALSEAYTYYRLYVQPGAPSFGLPMLDRYIIWGGVAGVLLFLGGTTGVVLGIRKSRD